MQLFPLILNYLNNFSSPGKKKKEKSFPVHITKSAYFSKCKQAVCYLNGRYVYVCVMINYTGLSQQ